MRYSDKQVTGSRERLYIQDSFLNALYVNLLMPLVMTMGIIVYEVFCRLTGKRSKAIDAL